MAKTATKPVPANMSEHVDAVAEEHRYALESADRLLREIKLAGRRPTYAEMVSLTRETGWSQKDVGTELRRMNTAIQNEEIAGTPKDREAAKKQAAKAAEVLESEGPKLRDQIEKLETQLRQIENDAKTTKQRVEDQADAVEKLIDNAPRFAKEEVQTRLRMLNETTRRDLFDLQGRANELRAVVDQGQQTQKAHLETVQRFDRRAVTDLTPDGHVHKMRFTDHWPMIREEAAKELAELEPKIEALQAEYDRDRAEIEKPLSYYALALHG
tara:strand:+ start:12121 stop:12930 length:810 start_codon:yes stop_codon:yes gene_type:complete